MTRNRRIFLQSSLALCLGAISGSMLVSKTMKAQEASEQLLKEMLLGSWKLESYSYESDGRTYAAPDEMEAIANFSDDQYDVEFSTYISAVGIKRTRKASESGTYSVTDDTIRLFADDASQEAEIGEEFLTDVTIEGDTMRLTSNNGSNHEVWTRIIE